MIGREWGPTARWSSRTFAVVWAGIVLSAAFPFALGTALALLAIWALQAGRRWHFAALAALTLAASPLAFLLLALVLAAIALARRADPRRLLVPGLAVLLAGLAQLALTRAFAGGGRYPYPPEELAAACAACICGAAITWRVERARVLCAIFLVLLAVTLSGMAVGIVYMLTKGSTTLGIPQFLGWFVLPSAIDGLLIAVLAVFVQVLSSNKYVGWGILFVWFVANIFLSNMGFSNPLYSYASSPSFPLSDFNGTAGEVVERAPLHTLARQGFEVGDVDGRRGHRQSTVSAERQPSSTGSPCSVQPRKPPSRETAFV